MGDKFSHHPALQQFLCYSLKIINHDPYIDCEGEMDRNQIQNKWLFA